MLAGERVALKVTTAGQRLDRYVADAVPALSRTSAQRLLDAGRITVNGALAKASYRVEAGDRIDVSIPPPEPVDTLPESIPLDVVYEDSDILVVDKPPGMVVHPAYGHRSGTLVNAVLAHSPDLAGVGGELRPGIVHRLDKDTSGLIVVAKCDRALQALQAQFKRREVTKLYVALVEGSLQPRTGIIDAPIGRDIKARKRMAVVLAVGREAQTKYRVLEYLPGYTLIEAEPKTGRTHQIRVHMAFIGHPLAGDSVYGHRRRPPGLTRHFLHAARLGMRLPSTNEWRVFESTLPHDLVQVLDMLRSERVRPRD